MERAIAERRIIRTWPIRGTLHLVAAADVRWMLALTSPKNIAAAARRRQQLELDDATLARCRKRFARDEKRRKVSCQGCVYKAFYSPLTDSGGDSEVMWGMDGRQNLIDMDKMVGKDFETGLARLKTIAEK